MENELGNLNLDLLNFAMFLTRELRTSCPYKTGNMQRSIAMVEMKEDSIKIVIATKYAAAVNSKTMNGSHRNIHYHWIEKVIDRCARSYAENNVENREFIENAGFYVVNK